MIYYKIICIVKCELSKVIPLVSQARKQEK